MSFFRAGWFLANAYCDEFDKAANEYTKMMLYACIAWAYLGWYNKKYNLESDDI